MPIAVTVTGVPELAENLAQLGADLGDLSELDQVGQLMAAAVARYAPRRTGALIASIEPDATRAAVVVTVGNARVTYANVVNYGSRRRHIAPRHFLSRGQADAEARLDEPVTAWVARLIERNNL